MKLDVINSDGTRIPLVGSDYFTITDIDGMTTGNVSISSNSVSGNDGDFINSQRVNPRDVTFTFRFKNEIPPEETKRYITSFFKLKKEVVIELNYRDRISRLTGVVQSVDIPRFTNAVSAQVGIYCSNPFWEDVQALEELIDKIKNLHHFPIHPTAEELIVMGEMTETYSKNIINNGDVDVGMRMKIIATATISNPKIIRDDTNEFFEVAVTMNNLDELEVCTIKGKKSVTLNGQNIINKVVSGSTWLQLVTGSNLFVVTNNLGGLGMTFVVKANERYI